MDTVILSIGDELVLGQTVDTNSAYLSAQLAARGIGTRYHQTIADDQRDITHALIGASKAAKVVIVSGGLGPTDDDLTRQALADAMGVRLVLDEASVNIIESYFKARGRAMPERNKVQAMHPQGTQVIPNTCGTAPGIRAELNGSVIYVTPGVPREMFEMFARSILPDISTLKQTRGVILATKINTFGAGESSVADKLGDLMRRDRNPKVGTTVSDGIVAVRVRSEFLTRDDAMSHMNDTITQIERMLGPIVYGREDQTIQDAAVAMLKERRQTIVTAESCTGGLVGKMLTDVSGSSDVYQGGWVTYTNDMKSQMLGVDANLFEAHGAVSKPVAEAMALGALQRSHADYSLAITGIAGPTGGTPHKPVGTVWIALGKRHADAPAVDALCYHFGGDRDTIRDRSAKTAIQMLRLHLLDAPYDAIEWQRPIPR